MRDVPDEYVVQFVIDRQAFFAAFYYEDVRCFGCKKYSLSRMILRGGGLFAF